MRINQTGKITNEFYVLGHASVPVFLLDGPVPALFDAGFTALAKTYEQAIKEVLGCRSPLFLFLTHTHWDHIGAAGYLKSIWPRLAIAGSPQAHDILTRPKAVRQIKIFNQDAIKVLRTWKVKQIYQNQFEPFDFNLALSPGKTIKLGPGLSVRAIPTPGHTWDLLSYWIPEKKILIASEAVACDEVSEFLVDYDVYRNSLKTLLELDVKILCTGHNLVLTGPDAKNHLLQSMNQAADYVDMVERFLREESENIDRVVIRVKKEEWNPKPLPKQPEEPYLVNTRSRVKTILKRMQEKDWGRA